MIQPREPIMETPLFALSMPMGTALIATSAMCAILTIRWKIVTIGGAFWSSWDEWQQADIVEDDRDSFVDDELDFAREEYGYEASQVEDYDWGYNEDEGYDPYAGEYTYDC